MTEILAIVVLCVIVSVVSFEFGRDVGRRQVHAGIVDCQTLPDKTAHCWKAEK